MVKDNTKDIEYTVGSLEPETTYKVYVIAYNNLGGNTKSNEINVSTTEILPPTLGTTNTNTGIRTGNQLPFGWDDLGKIAKIVANSSSTITSDTSEFNITYEGEDYTIGVGDWARINGKKVRILGFNHDNLVNKSVYQNEDGHSNETAGISFEYVDFVTEDMQMYNGNAKSWGSW